MTAYRDSDDFFTCILDPTNESTRDEVDQVLTETGIRSTDEAQWTLSWTSNSPYTTRSSIMYIFTVKLSPHLALHK